MPEPEIVTETLEPGHLESRVLEGQSRIDVGPDVAKGSGIADEGSEPLARQPEVEGMPRGERILAEPK